jgi:hypothetical protein
LAKIIGCRAGKLQGKLTEIEDEPGLWHQHKVVRSLIILRLHPDPKSAGAW